MAVLGLRFCARALSSRGKWGPLLIAVHRPLTIAASLVAEHRLQTRRLSNCGSQAQSLHGMWDPPRPGLEPMSPALAGRFSTTVPPRKPCPHFCLSFCFILLLGSYFHPSIFQLIYLLLLSYSATDFFQCIFCFNYCVVQHCFFFRCSRFSLYISCIFLIRAFILSEILDHLY